MVQHHPQGERENTSTTHDHSKKVGGQINLKCLALAGRGGREGEEVDREREEEGKGDGDGGDVSVELNGAKPRRLLCGGRMGRSCGSGHVTPGGERRRGGYYD